MEDLREKSGGSENEQNDNLKQNIVSSPKAFNPLNITSTEVNILRYNSCDDVRQAIKAALDAQTKDILNLDKRSTAKNLEQLESVDVNNKKEENEQNNYLDKRSTDKNQNTKQENEQNNSSTNEDASRSRLKRKRPGVPKNFNAKRSRKRSRKRKH